jgi:hypothetical protein
VLDPTRASRSCRSISNPKFSIISRRAYRHSLTEGSGKMKPVKSVKGKAVDDVIAYVRTMKK